MISNPSSYNSTKSNTLVPLFTPIHFKSSPCEEKFRYVEFAEAYFDYGRRKVVNITKCSTDNQYFVKIEESKKKNLLLLALKIISLVTIILPLIIIGIKAYFRWNSKFQIELHSYENKKIPGEVQLFKSGDPFIMSIDSDIRFTSAMKQFDKDLYEISLNQFSELALDLFISKGIDAFDEIEKSMMMAIASYKKIDNTAVAQILEETGGDTFEQFFHVMRHYMDHTVETENAKVEKELSKEIPLGIPEEKSHVHPENIISYEESIAGPYNVSVITAQGPRDTMEDEHLVTEISVDTKAEGQQKVQVFAVFDGHGGDNCAKYVKEVLPKFIQEALQETKVYSDLEIFNALRKAFISIDSSWANLPIQKTEHIDYSGTTATVCLVLGKNLWVANVGDSRTVLAMNGDAIQLSEEAKATVAKYEREIYLRGGDVKFGRVVGEQGSLDMARSIGDLDQPSVSALPTIRKFDLSTLKNDNNQLILACDGLWDVVSPQIAVKVCNQSKNIKEATHTLKKIAFNRGTTDNVSVMVVDLKGES